MALILIRETIYLHAGNIVKHSFGIDLAIYIKFFLITKYQLDKLI